MLMLTHSSPPQRTCFHLVRHGVHSELGQLLSGRAGSASLTRAGRMQAAGVAEWLGSHPVAAVHASPRRRTMETAMIIASAVGGEVAQAEALDEIDFGRWNGRSFAELEDDPLWSAWNRHRSIASTPGGETMAQAVERTVLHLESLAAARPGEALLCVTHCDIIRGTLAHYLGLSLDNILRFDIDPGSISTIEIGAEGTRVTRINEVAA